MFAILHSYIPITNNIQVNDLYKSIATGHLYTSTEFEGFSDTVPGDTWNSNKMGRQTLYS